MNALTLFNSSFSFPFNLQPRLEKHAPQYRVFYIILLLLHIIIIIIIIIRLLSWRLFTAIPATHAIDHSLTAPEASLEVLL